MSQTSASDSDPELDYSDEEIRCSFSRSPTLTDEDDEDIPCFARSNFGLSHDERKELLMCEFIQQQNQDVKLYPEIMHRWLKENHPDILQRLHHFVKDKNHFTFCAPSVLQSLDNRIAHSLPKGMICDVCIFTEDQPTFVLTFRTREGVKDMVGALNAKLSRYIATEIRRVTSRNFSTVYGVVDKQHCLSDQLFDARVEVLINFVNIMAAPSSLRMNYATYRSSAHCFLKMVPEQTSDWTADYIDEGKDIFIERNGYTPCKDRLKTHRSVVIVSPPGEGKTTLGRALLRHFRDVQQEDGTLYQPIILQTPEEWQKHVDKTSHQIIFIDDMFGKCVLSQSKLKQWRDIMPEMIHSLVGGLKLLVMTMRCNIYSDLSATCPLKLFQPDNVVDLWLKRPLLSKDKESLVRIHSQHHDVSVTEDYIKKVATFDKVPGFPLLCKTLMQSVTIGERTFSDMDDVHIEILATEMQNLKDYNLTSFALLVTVVLNGGSINKVKVPPCLTQVCQYLKCAHMEFMSLLHHSKACFEIYLADNGETITISHPNVQQAVARVFSMAYPMEMIKHASAKQLSDIFTVTTEDMSQISADWKIRLNRVEEWKELGKRFIVLIQNGDLADVCSHQAFNIKAFIETFFKLQTNKKMSKLLLTQDTEHGLPMLYWSVFTQNSFFSEIIIEKMKIFTKTRMENIMSKFGKAINRTKEIEMLSSSTIASLLAHNMDALENILKTLPEDSKQNVLNMKLDRQTFPTRNKQQGTVYIRGCKTMSELAVRGGCSEALVVLGKFVEDIDDLKMDQHIERAILEGNLNMLQSLLKTISNMGLEEILESMTRTDDGKEHTFLCLAVQIGNIDIVRELVMCGGDTHLIECCKPLLDICLEQNNLQVAQLLLKHDSTTAASDQSMLMPQLCEKNKTAAVKLLLQHGCDVNTRSTTGFTLLQIACLMKYCKLLKTLLDYKADVMQVDSDGNTVLHQSVCHSSEDVVAILAKYYQRNHQFLNCRNKDGNTALMIAIKGKEVMIANILLEYDVVVNTVNNNGDTPLHYACGIPSMDIVSVLLSRNADTNISNMQRVTPLHVACDNGELKTIQHEESSLGQRTPRSHHASSISDEIINVLLAKGNTVNVQTVTGDTALHYACRLSRHRAVDALVRADADIKVQNKDGEIPLHLACKIPYSPLISLLVTRTLVDMKNTSGNTPLHLACLHDNTGAVDTLLKMEADLNVHNNEHHTPLCIAFWRKSHGALEIILNKYRTTNLKYVMCSTSENRCAAAWIAYSKADLSDYSDFTLVKEPILHHLCRRNNWEDMDLLLTQDISLEMINQCLHLACKLGNVSIIRSLLQHNADPGSRNHHKNTVLHVAVASNSGEAVNTLIKGHAVIKYINGQNNSGDTVLHIACRHTNTDIMETLLKAGADANIKNHSDEAAIHLTCKQKDSKPVEILLDKGCDANSLSKGLSPLHIACEYSNLAVVRVLVKHKANVNAQANFTTPLHVAERQKKGDIVCYLIENGANKFAKDVDQHTPLAYRYYVNGHVHITPRVEMLLNKRSDVNCALPDGNTALIHEVKENHLDVVKELIRRGAIIDKHDKEGRSPLLIACYFGFADIVKYLVDKGASIDSPDVEGQTPLYIACDYGHADIAKFLISRGADPNFASKHEENETPRHIIERSGNVEIKRLYKLIKLPKVQE